VFTLGVLWNINPFDQWGVELGKRIARPLEKKLAAAQCTSYADLAALLYDE
jgi:glucose-6-phosphate isomerase